MKTLALLGFLLAPNDICFIDLDLGYCYGVGDGGPPCSAFRTLRSTIEPYCCFPPGLDCCDDSAACGGSTFECNTCNTTCVTLEAPCMDSDSIPTPPVGWWYMISLQTTCLGEPFPCP